MKKVLVLSGGVGGAKLALGLYRVLDAGNLVVAVNTGDDFDHLGLRICPDLDTTVYTLAGVADREQGWGRANETWRCLDTLADLGGAAWFRLGDQDLALHLLRTQALTEGASLSRFTEQLTQKLGVHAEVLPMSDQWVSTAVQTPEGRLWFQEYFVKRRCEPPVAAIEYSGAEQAQPNAQLLRYLASDDLRAIVIAPSNPFLSIAPLLAMPGLRAALQQARAPVVAVSPLIGNKAVKGPTAKIMRELNLTPSAPSVARYYAGLLDGFVVDTQDAALAAELTDDHFFTNTLMVTLEDRERLAREVLAYADRLPLRSR